MSTFAPLVMVALSYKPFIYPFICYFQIKKHKFSYFKSVWNILDILVIAIAIVCVAFNVYRTLKVDELLEDLLSKPDEYSDFNFLSLGQSQFDNAIAIAVFLAWIKVSCLHCLGWIFGPVHQIITYAHKSGQRL